MDYLSQKIKSVPKIEATPEFHRRIMRQAFYTRFRYHIWILTLIVIMSTAVDGWHILNHSFTKVIGSLATDFSSGPASLSKMSVGVIEKALAHPDLIFNLILDFCLIAYIFYVITAVRGAGKGAWSGRFSINPLAWFRYVIRGAKIAKQ